MDWYVQWGLLLYNLVFWLRTEACAQLSPGPRTSVLGSSYAGKRSRSSSTPVQSSWFRTPASQKRKTEIVEKALGAAEAGFLQRTIHKFFVQELKDIQRSIEDLK